MHVDYKVSIWERIEFYEDVSEEFVKSVLRTEGVNGLYAHDLVSNTEGLINTEEQIYPSDNDGQATVELYRQKGDSNSLWNNAKTNNNE